MRGGARDLVTVVHDLEEYRARRIEQACGPMRYASVRIEGGRVVAELDDAGPVELSPAAAIALGQMMVDAGRWLLREREHRGVSPQACPLRCDCDACLNGGHDAE